MNASSISKGQEEVINNESQKWVMPRWDLEEDVVITGISGRFPESDNIEELKQNLYDGVDMITENDRRWKPGLFGTPKRMGKLKDIEHFDALFFGVHGKQAEVMDPMQRLMLEAVYEAIFDAGYNPASLRGRNIGVFVGCSEKSVSGDAAPEELLTGYELLGMCTALMANRVSFTYGFTGPSLTLDTACSSTMHALHEAILALKTNRCDAAIVGGGTISLSVSLSISFSRLGLTSQEGTCKVFDATANGYVRSEAVGAVFLQRASDARRCYASILHCKLNNDGLKQEGISYPSAKQQKQLFKEVYSELGFDAAKIDYLEAHGTGTVAGDREESNAIADYFLPGRDSPLLVGSVKSNLGHAEAASGICTLAKVILAMEEGVIPPNLHYKEPNPHVPALVEGKMKVITEKTPWTPGIVAVNNFGFGGSNAHLVLKSYQKENLKTYERNIPRLVLVSGRNEASVQYIFKKIEEEKFTDEALVLLEEACKAPTSGMRYRGFGLVQDPGKEIQYVIEKSPAQRRPVWFLFSGMGSQWSGMAKEMMKLDSFAESIKKSAEILKPYGVNLLHLLTEASDDELNHIVAPFVTIAAVQIALVDVIKKLGIEPDGIVGHSVGELGCAYADGCFTAKQMILAAFWRGNSCAQTKLIYGAMAAVGMTWEDVKKRCPEDVYPVCHNAEDSVTISGPAESVKAFVKSLTEENIFARAVKTCDIAFHSKYVEPASHIMRKELAKVIPNPQPRSARWVSSSVPEEEWTEPHAQLSSVEYHVNNLLSPVLFNEAMSKVPKNALIIEFAPHSLLQPIVKRILGQESIYVGLMKRGHEDNLNHFLSAVGKLYTSNLEPEAKNLYEEITFPVSRGTAMLNSLIKWDHMNRIETWNFNRFHANKNNVWVDTFRGSAFEYFKGHKVDGRILFPFMGYVLLAWRSLAKHLLLEMEELPVILEDISVYRATLPGKSGTYVFTMKMLDSAGNFRIEDNGSLVASGKIRAAFDDCLRMKDEYMESIADKEESFILDAKDFYKELRLRGYEYGPTFQGVLSADAKGHCGRIKWEDRWVSFMDAMLQIPILCVPLRALLLPTRVTSIRIDPRLKPEANPEGVPLYFNPHINVCRAGPVEIQGLHCGIAPKRKDHQNSPVLEEHVFVPLFDSCILTKEEKIHLEEYVHVCSTLAHKILKDSGKDKTVISAVINGFKDAPKELIQKYTDMHDKNHVLLKFFKEVLEAEPSNGMQENFKNIYATHEADLHGDLLTTVSLRENSLRAALDVVQDNHFSPKMKILEVSGPTLCRKSVLKMLGMTTLGLVKYEYTVARISEDVLPEGILDNDPKIVQCNIKDTPLPSDNELIISKDIFSEGSHSPTEMLKAMAKSVKENGFIVLMERTCFSPAEKFVSVLLGKDRHTVKENMLEEHIAEAGLVIIAKKKDQVSSVLYLLRKLSEKPDKSFVPNIFHITEDFSWVEPLQAKLKEEEEDNIKAIWLMSEEPCSGILGFMSCLKLEPEGKRLRCYFNASFSAENSPPKFEYQEDFFKDIFRNDLVYNVFQNGQWGMLRHRLLPPETAPVPRKDSYVNVLKRGDLSSLRWIESNQVELDASRYENKYQQIQIYYSPLNFRDVMLATGKLPPDVIPKELAMQECLIGMEFVGRDESGRRVMGFAPYKGLATTIAAQDGFSFPIPDEWTMEEACTVPVTYATVYYAMIVRGQMKRGESILIHSGTGGVGQAAICIALSMDCDVFVTVGTDEKKQYLKEIFPNIKDDHISSSRDVIFEFDIKNATNGEGVDLVLNSLSDDKLQASVRCLKTNGRFLEIGKYDMAMNTELGMAAFLKNISFHGIFLDTVLWESKKRNQDISSDFRTFLVDGMKSGFLRPMKANVFKWDQVEEAFRFMASGKHIGKVVIQLREEEKDGKPVVSPLWIPCVPRTYCHPDKSYIITGALGGFGFELAGWLVEKGAKNLVLSCRSSLKNEYQRLWIERWRKFGISIVLDQNDISSMDGTTELLEKANALAPVGGIFHLAMVLHDSLFENLKAEYFEEVCVSKVKGVRNLDTLTRKLCPQLEHFVVFSSIACGRGNPGQSNYAYANSVMERVVERRRQENLPGLAIQWGGIGDVGVVYEKMGGNEVILKGTVPQRMNSCLDVMDRFMQEKCPIVSSFVPVEKSAFSSASEEDVVEMLCKVLGISDPSQVKPEMTLGELGMDSLMGVEIKQVLETEYDTVLSVPEVRQLSIRQLKEISKNKVLTLDKVESRDVGEGLVIIGEQYVPTEILVPLNDKKGSHCVFFVHPIDGHINMLKKLGAHATKRAYGLQFTDKVPCETIKDIAACYIEHIREVQPHGPYNIVGYSFGTVIAFEMALQLQKTDQVKTFICIDGSPAAVEEGSKLFITEDEKKQLNLTRTPLMLFLHHYFAQVPKQVEDAMQNLPIGDTILHARKMLHSFIGDSLNDEIVASICDRLYQLSWASKIYKPGGLFRGRATLIRSSEGERLKELKMPRLEDYGLKQHVDGSVEIYTIKCDHINLVNDTTNEVSKIINDRI